jgi:hypothetical protein
MEIYLHAFLSTAMDDGEWSSSRPDRLTSGERTPDTHFVGDLMGPRASLDVAAKRKSPTPAGYVTAIDQTWAQ